MKKAISNTNSRINNSDGLMMVWVPSGSFLMGAPKADTLSFPNEKPQVEVEISRGFWITTTQVTQKALASILGEDFVRSTMRGDERPATDLCLAEIFAYCDKVGGRLPSEAEWEWAARAGNSNHRPLKPKEVGWYSKNSKGELQPVGKKKPNEWGLYDTMGNVCEVTATPWAFHLLGGRDPGLGDRNLEVQRVVRGGSWWNAESCMSVTARSGFTHQNKIPGNSSQVGNTHGFRYVVEGDGPDT